MINYQRIKLKFSQLIKHLLFNISYKICKHSLISIDFTASVYELFDNPSYIFFNLLTIKPTCNIGIVINHTHSAPCVWYSFLSYSKFIFFILSRDSCMVQSMGFQEMIIISMHVCDKHTEVFVNSSIF